MTLDNLEYSLKNIGDEPHKTDISRYFSQYSLWNLNELVKILEELINAHITFKARINAN
jgi:hypothetical protein